MGKYNMETVISIDIRSDGTHTFDIWIAHEGSSGVHYKKLTAAQIGKETADYIECMVAGYDGER